MDLNNTTKIFNEGLVVGIDVGTAGFGYAVRRGGVLLDAGVAVLDSDTANLEDRRKFRRMRRTIRSRRQRLAALKSLLEQAGFPAPVSANDAEKLSPALLRLKALRGEKLAPDQIHRAVFSLWKRRGYMEPEWARNRDKTDDEKENIDSVNAARAAMQEAGVKYPCESAV